MSMPLDELSSQPVVSEIKFPDKLPQYPDDAAGLLFDREHGGIALNDPSMGLHYQAWNVSYVADEVIVTAETTAVATPAFTLPGITELSLAFDQNMNGFIAYVAGGVSWYFWYDPISLQYEHVQMAAGVTRPRCGMDDKRLQMVDRSDILLGYMLGGSLYYRQERDRYTIERLLHDSPVGEFHQVSMGINNRIHYSFWTEFAQVPPPDDPDNLDFESGDVNWTQETGAAFSINQVDPQSGSWGATLDTIPADYSRFVNDSYFPVTGSQAIRIKVAAKVAVQTGLAFGYQVYDAGFAYLGRHQLSVNAGTSWETFVWDTTVPATAVNIRLVLSSNATDGIIYLDNMTLDT